MGASACSDLCRVVVVVVVVVVLILWVIRRVLTFACPRVNSVVFSPDDKLIASGSNDKSIKVWDSGRGADKEQGTKEAQGEQGHALVGEVSALSKPSSTEQVVGGFIFAAKGTLVLVHEVAQVSADKVAGTNADGGPAEQAAQQEKVVEEKLGTGEQKQPVAFFAAPSHSQIKSLVCAGDKIAVGLEDGGVLYLSAAFLGTQETLKPNLHLSTYLAAVSE